jgi:SAM-dependent methyltransferase
MNDKESKDGKIKSLVKENSNVWNNYYKVHQEGAVGNLYPNEPLIRIASKIFHSVEMDKYEYFNNVGKENDEKNRIKDNKKTSLDIGFGHVSNMLMMKDKGFLPQGIEVSAEAVERGRQSLSNLKIDDIKLSEWNDRPKLPFADDSFDMIYGLQCIYYNLDIEQVIDEVFRCLKKDGIFCFSFFSTRHDYHNYSNLIEEFELYNVREWSSDHPSTRIRGAKLIAPKSKEDLAKMFNAFSQVRVFTEETDFMPMFNSWDYVYGIK